MVASILATKLYIPPPRPNVVLRPRLIERLNEGLQNNRKLILVAAPAGFGKTTLVSDWLAGSERKVAWLSLDEADNDPARFLTYLVASLQTIAPGTGAGLLEEQSPPTEAVLAALINEINAIPYDFLLVLDDYHLVDSRPVDRLLSFLLEHLPPRMRLVITTREDPQLPLPRLRARGQLTELRAVDLRFSPAEAANFLNQVMGLKLVKEDIAALEKRTEGWIAGLQLAALSIQSQQDVTGFIQAFTGDHRYIVDYLVEEVLNRQSEGVRRFLLQTAILDRFNASLCEAVTGQEQSKARLEALERGNYFIVPLDDRRQWYRYHHLFAEVLTAHLLTEQPDELATLHRRASAWFELNGLAVEAIRHSLTARDFERAANLIEPVMSQMQQTRQEATLLGWLGSLPDELVRCRPVLSATYGGVLLASGRFGEVDAHLRNAERWLQPNLEDNNNQSRKMVVIDDAAFRQLPGSIAIWRAGLALVQGDLSATIKYARRALELTPEEAHLWRGAAASLMGLAYWTGGELTAGYRAYAEGRARLQMAGYISDVMGCTIALTDIKIEQGRLNEARHIFEKALELVAQHGARALRGTADMYVGLSRLYLEHNDLNTAVQYLMKSQELGELAGLPQNPYRWRVAMARIRQAQGDLDGALEFLQQAEKVYVGDFFPNVRPIAALRVRVWVAQGRLEEASGWAQEKSLSAGDDLSYLREFEYITLARLQLVRCRSNRDSAEVNQALDLLERLLQAAQAGGRTGSVIEILLLLSLAYHLQGGTGTALVSLERALTLAEPEGYFRIFVDEGPPMVQLLQEAARQKISPNYVRRLLAAFDEAEDTGSPSPTLIEPLSERELQVLRLLGSEMSGPEIARQLMVSLNTLNTHIKNIYGKLGVNNRRAALRQAEELHLF